MIRDFFFVLRMLVFTILIVVFSQVRIASKSLEDYFQGWIKTSILVDSIQEAVDGGLALTKASYHKMDMGMHSALAKLHSHHALKDRGLHFSLKRFNEKDSDDGDMVQSQSQHAQPLQSKSSANQIH